MAVKRDLIGQRFGRLVVLEKTDKRDKSGCFIWKCKCDCGNIIYRPTAALTRAKYGTKSCGCYKSDMAKIRSAKNLIGKKFGKLLVLEKTDERSLSESIIWKCQCDCGQLTYAATNELTTGHKKSCGCYQKEKAAEVMADTMKKYNTYDLTNDYGIGYTTKGEPFYFDKEDYDLIKDYCWTLTKGYLLSSINHKTMQLHRLVMGVGAYDGNTVIDHINHNTRDNRKSNLRICTHALNGRNRKVKGAYQKDNSNKWFSMIKVDGELHHLGTYETEEEALEARRKAEEKYFQEYSYDNSMKISEDIERKETNNGI